MQSTKELLFKNMQRAINLCKDCLQSYCEIFNWHSRHGTRNLSFAPFYKDYGNWAQQLTQLPIFINKDANYDEKNNAYNKLYQVGIALYHRVGNALNAAEITNAFKKGPANFFTNCGKFAAQMQLVAP